MLTQARTSKNRPYAFIVELNDGGRKFMKGPFKSVEAAQGHVICNEVKLRLASKYLLPIQCEIKVYGDQLVFLDCEEIGKADLDEVAEKRTKLEGGNFEVLNYESNDVVPDPLSSLTEINEKNRDVWLVLQIGCRGEEICGLPTRCPAGSAPRLCPAFQAPGSLSVGPFARFPKLRSLSIRLLPHEEVAA